MAAIWLVQGKTLQPVRRLDSIVPILPDNRESMTTQELFQHMHDTKLWLLCGCTKPDARMFVRKIADGRYALINHSEHGVHDASCPLATDVKGEAAERSAPDSTDGGGVSTKQSEYRLLSPFKKVDLLAMDGVFLDEKEKNVSATDEEEDGSALQTKEVKASPASKIDFLFQLLWQLIDDAFLAHRHPGQEVSVVTMETRLKSASCKINLKGFGPLNNYTFTGPKGLQMLHANLLRDHRRAPKLRHQYLFLAVVKDFSYDRMGSMATLIDGSALILGQAARKPLVLNGMGENHNEGPFILAAIYGFNRPTDDQPVILKWAVQPLVSDKLLVPVNSWVEKMLVTGMTKSMDKYVFESAVTRDYKIWLYKPVLPSPDPMTGVWVQPVLSIVAKNQQGERCRVAYRLSHDDADLGAYRRTFEHVHSFDINAGGQPSEQENMFLLAIGVFEQHFRNLRIEAQEQEHMAAGQSLSQRMREREDDLQKQQAASGAI